MSLVSQVHVTDVILHLQRIVLFHDICKTKKMKVDNPKQTQSGLSRHLPVKTDGHFKFVGRFGGATRQRSGRWCLWRGYHPAEMKSCNKKVEFQRDATTWRPWYVRARVRGVLTTPRIFTARFLRNNARFFVSCYVLSCQIILRTITLVLVHGSWRQLVVRN